MLRVVIPFTTKEVPLVLKNLALVKKLDGKLDAPALLPFEEGTDGVQAVVDAAEKIFTQVECLTYHKGPTGWPQGPNHAFKATAWHLGERSKRDLASWLWWEADAVPLRKGWLTDLDAAHANGGQPFSGHVVEGMGHMNGVGIYPPDVRLHSSNAMLCMNTPWDVAMKKETARFTHAINHLILHVWNVHNGAAVNSPEGSPLTVKNKKELARWITPEAALLHRCKDGSVADVLLK